MILYNVTVKIDQLAHEEWLQWMQEVHIPNVMATGIFLEYRMGRLLGMDEPDGVTYAIQYYCTDLAAFELYQKYFAKQLQAEVNEKFRGKFVAFRTLLEIVDKGAFYAAN
ncbi:MAG TPA: DUF4286 family protein [Saprospiraceae bacterium]|nr:DUF4286 family protein [Saprospiraceae bacterium]HMP13591.1 DUF4286 family protein [Saprospiraceae bacterium]